MTPLPTGTEAAVCADIAKRQEFGRKKYGTTVAENPLVLKQWLQHAYEECLDQAVYLKRAIEELDKMVPLVPCYGNPFTRLEVGDRVRVVQVGAGVPKSVVVGSEGVVEWRSGTSPGPHDHWYEYHVTFDVENRRVGMARSELIKIDAR